MSGQFGQSPGGLPGLKVVLDPAKNLAPEKQRNESYVRSMHLSNIRPVPEMLALYGVGAILINVPGLLQGSVLGAAFVLSGVVDVLGVFVIPRRGSSVGGYYAVTGAIFNVLTLLWALASGVMSGPIDWWTSGIMVLAIFAFGGYPLITIGRNWTFFIKTH